MADELVLVLSTPSVPEGEIARSRLEDEGIPVLVKGLDSPYRMGPVHLFVPAGFEVQARLVLESSFEAAEDDAASLEGGIERSDATPSRGDLESDEVSEPEERA